MSTHRARFLALVTSLAAIASVSALACAPAKSTLPERAHLEILQTQKLVLHGTAAAHPESATCASGEAGSEPLYLRLNEDMTGNFVLRPGSGVAVLHLQELATNRTWCVMTHGDGTGASIPGEFPGGVYSITVEGSHASGPTPYSVVVERL
jgi:hypothetical protein